VQGDRNAPHPAGKDNPALGAAEADDGVGLHPPDEGEAEEQALECCSESAGGRRGRQLKGTPGTRSKVSCIFFVRRASTFLWLISSVTL